MRMRRSSVPWSKSDGLGTDTSTIDNYTSTIDTMHTIADSQARIVWSESRSVVEAGGPGTGVSALAAACLRRAETSYTVRKLKFRAASSRLDSCSRRQSRQNNRALARPELNQVSPVDLMRIGEPSILSPCRHDRANRLRIAEIASHRYGWPLHVIENCADDPPRDQPRAFLDALRVALGTERSPRVIANRRPL